MLFHVLIVVFVLVCVLLTLFILVQSDKGGGISGAVGGGISNANSAIGAQNTENILTRGTTTLAIVYFVLAIILFLLSTGKLGENKGSGFEKAAQEQQASGPGEMKNTAPAKTTEATGGFKPSLPASGTPVAPAGGTTPVTGGTDNPSGEGDK